MSECMNPSKPSGSTFPVTPSSISPPHSPRHFLSPAASSKVLSLLPTSDYSSEIHSWISCFQQLNQSINKLYTMCANESIRAFTEGALSTLQHAAIEFAGLSQTQIETSIDISDPLESIDGKLLQQYLDEGLTPTEGLVLLVKEKAAEFSYVEEDLESSWEKGSSCSNSSRTKLRSHSHGRPSGSRAIEEKLSQREKLSPHEVKERSENRMNRAQYKKKLLELQRRENALERQKRMRKIKEVLEQQEQEKKSAIQLQIALKQNKADERYEAHLRTIRERAKTESMKLNDIAYIVCKEIEEKKMNLEQKLEETRDRRDNLLDGVKNKQAGRAVKGEAAEKRRQALELEREQKLLSSQQKQHEAESRRHKILQERKVRAEELTKRRRERALFSVQTAPKAEKKLEDWDVESFSSAEDIPNLLAYRTWDKAAQDSKVKVTFSKRHRRIQRQRVDAEPRNWCCVCNYELPSGLSALEHTQGERHYAELDNKIHQGNLNEPILVTYSAQELADQRELYIRKRAKKVKQLAASRALRHEKVCIVGKESSGANKNRLQKLSIDLEKSISNQIDYPAVESIVKETIKLLDQRREADLHVIRQLKFIPCLMEIVKKPWSCPRHELKLVLQLVEIVLKFLTIFSGLTENRTYMIVSNRIVPLVELLCFILGKPVKLILELTYLPQLFHLFTLYLKHRTPYEHSNMREYFVEYMLNCGLITRLKQKLQLLSGPLDLSSNSFSLLLLECVALLEALIKFPGWGLGVKPAFEVSMYLSENFIYIFRVTELAGVPYLLLCLLMHDGVPKQGQGCLPIPQTLITLSILSMRFLNNLARLHLPLFQEQLSSEEYSASMYHLFHYLLKYCTEHLDSGPEDVRELLHEVTLLIGYFVVLSPCNQEMMNRGETCILQRLCVLPFAYFSNKKLMTVLFPTLISICYGHRHNLSILHQEMSVDLLVKYITQQSALVGNELEEEDKGDPVRNKGTRSISSGGSSSKSILAAASFKLEFLNRFPRHLWSAATEFFKENCANLV